MRSRLFYAFTSIIAAGLLGSRMIFSAPIVSGANLSLGDTNRVYLPMIYGNPYLASPTPVPPPTSTPKPIPTSTPIPSPPQIAHSSLHVDSINYTHVLGEVVNGSGSTIYNPSIIVTFFNADDTVAGTHQTYTYASMIQSGEKASFDNLSNPQSGWSRYTLSLSYDTSTYTAYSHAFVFSGQNQYSDAYSQYYTGQITNTSGQTLKYPQVISTGYDANGNVIAVEYTYANAANDQIAPGATAPYQISIPLNEAASVTKMAFMAEGWH